MNITQEMRQNKKENENFYFVQCEKGELADEVLVASSYDEAENDLLHYYEIDVIPESCTLEEVV